ncbi:MAG: hypothetical protein SFV17_16295 [Candidatus Obscuribacter sp.]|nr:hypothetical protein [Candidatus Melainabacteria bacterium]MDX1988247.1 hypothetical protein [Candidatus Obscuribacter sp.]
MTSKFFPQEPSSALDPLNFDPHAYLAESGFFTAVDQAFAALSAELDLEFEQLNARMNARFDEIFR